MNKSGIITAEPAILHPVTLVKEILSLNYYYYYFSWLNKGYKEINLLSIEVLCFSFISKFN